MKTQIPILLTCILITTSCISRLARPILTGTVMDFNSNPIDSCIVGETLTDSQGNFKLKERRYRRFFIPEIIYTEAPPVFVSELISKEGYEEKVIRARSIFGGGARKGTVWHMDTIYLKSISTAVNVRELIQDKWMLSTNKNIDTLYFIKANFDDICNTWRCQSFNNEYYKYADDYFGVGQKYLPEGVIRKYIAVNFKADKMFDTQKIVQKDRSNKFRSDTTQTQGEWLLNDNQTIDFKSEFPELNGRFILYEVDYEYMEWHRISNDE